MMKKHLVAVVAGLAIAFSAQAQQRPEGKAPVETTPALASGPFLRIYDVSGVIDNDFAFVDFKGVSSVFQCTNLGATKESIRWTIRQFNGAVVKDIAGFILPQQTLTAVTHKTSLAKNDVNLQTGKVSGSATISATTRNVVCSAMIMDASVNVPNGIALHMRRSNPLSGTEE